MGISKLDIKNNGIFGINCKKKKKGNLNSNFAKRVEKIIMLLLLI